jgi:hypothetical protein
LEEEQAVVAERPLVGVNNQKTTQMAAPAGSSAVEAYKKTKSPGGKPSVSAADFVPRASAEVAGKSSALYEKATKDLAGATSGDPFKKAPSKELPSGTYGGRKSRRRKSRRRGGAMIKSIDEHLADLRASRTRATLENILSDLEASGVRALEDYARLVKGNLLNNPGEEGARPYMASTERMLEAHLPVGRRPGGRRRKTTRRR